MGESHERELVVERLKLVDYRICLEHQRSLHRSLIDGIGNDTLILCSHPPTITRGSSTAAEHLLVDSTMLKERAIGLEDIERGGSITYHGPEQLVGYPILNLNHHRRDVGWYMRSLEEVVIRVLSEYGIASTRSPGRTGVWIDESSKISFLGVRISRWCTLHGFSLNVENCAESFRLINPCGLGDVRVISMSEILGFVPDRSELEERLVMEFCKVFGYDREASEN